jgi:hypothetical protein
MSLYNKERDGKGRKSVIIEFIFLNVYDPLLGDIFMKMNTNKNIDISICINSKSKFFCKNACDLNWHSCFIQGRRGHDCIVVGFTTTSAISAYHHKHCEFESRSW